MKKIRFKSIFTKTIAIMLPLVLLINLIILIALYWITYQYNYEKSERDVTTAANVIEDFVGIYDFNNEAELAELNASLSALCREFDISYAYVLDVDATAGTQKYLAIGYGNLASKSFKNERKVGDVVQGDLSEVQIRVAKNEQDYGYEHLKNRFDDTVVCYVPLKHVYNEQLKTFEENDNRGRIVAAEISFLQVMQHFRTNFVYVALITLVLAVLMTVGFALILKQLVAKPVGKISRQMQQFAENHIIRDEKLYLKDSTEIGRMAHSFNAMTDEITTYLHDIESLNKEKHMQEAELGIAKKIQLGLLPAPALRMDTANIDAYILPARNVGGDFYDYRIMEDGTVNFAIADVSGKGVAAALFVSRAITLLQMYSDLGFEPAETMAHYNDKLAAQNPNKLFITTFLAKYNPHTGELTYTNAGHNAPYLLSDTLTPLEGAAGMAAGIFAGETYEQETIRLQKGDVLFLYTDGVNEAQNTRGELLSTERLEAILSAHIADKRGIIPDVLQEIESFSEGAEQSDDITMLCLKTPGAFYHQEFTLAADVQNLTTVNEALEHIPAISEELRLNLNLMAEEIFVNLCSYAYAGKEGEIFFSVNVADTVELTFKDAGTRFNPTKNLLDIESYDHEHTVGGLGRFITFNLADDYEYRYENGANILKLIKNIETNANEA